MNLISKLIILPFLLICHNSISQTIKKKQNKDQESVKPRTPVDSNRYRKIYPHKGHQKNFISDKNDKNQIHVIETKTSIQAPIQDLKTGSVLDNLIRQYWMIQNDIKKAKKEKDLVRIAYLEKNSLSCRNDYILAFENTEHSDRSREEQKLYLAFKKDLSYE